MLFPASTSSRATTASLSTQPCVLLFKKYPSSLISAAHIFLDVQFSTEAVAVVFKKSDSHYSSYQLPIAPW